MASFLWYKITLKLNKVSSPARNIVLHEVVFKRTQRNLQEVKVEIGQKFPFARSKMCKLLLEKMQLDTNTIRLTRKVLFDTKIKFYEIANSDNLKSRKNYNE